MDLYYKKDKNPEQIVEILKKEERIEISVEEVWETKGRIKEGKSNRLLLS